MVKRFSDHDVRPGPNRALQIWQILICRASNRQTMTYGELADKLGFKSARGMGTFLGYVMRYCENNRLPPLTVIVVNKATGLPGAGLPLDDLHAERERVFSFDWFGLVPPTPQELLEAVNEAP